MLTYFSDGWCRLRVTPPPNLYRAASRLISVKPCVLEETDLAIDALSPFAPYEG